MSLTAQIYTSPEIFRELQSEWYELLKHAQTNHIFQTPAFLGTWWQTLGRGELRVITVRTESGMLVGIAPLFLPQDAPNQLSFIGCVDVSDYLDCIVHREWIEAVYKSIAEQLLALPWKTLYLCSLPDSSPTPIQLSELLRTRTTLEKQQQDVSPVLQLPRSWEAYLESLDRKQRHEIRRKWRKLKREHEYTFTTVTQVSEISDAVPAFIELHKASSPGKKRFWDEHHVAFFTQFLERAAERNWLRLSFLSVEGKRASSMLAFEYAQRTYLYNSGYDPNYYRELSTGSTLTAYTIRAAIEQGHKAYDFLRGDEQYKFRFGAVSEPVWDLRSQT